MKNCLLIVAISAIFISCTSNNEEALPILSDEDTMEQIASTLTLDIGSFTQDIATISAKLQDGRIDGGRIESCGQERDTTVNRSFQGSSVTYDFVNDYTFIFFCDGDLPAQLVIDFKAAGNYIGRVFSSLGITIGDFEVTGFVDSDVYLLNGTINRNYNLTRQDDDDFDYNTEGVAIIRDLSIGKSSRMIESGTANFSVEGKRSSGVAFVYTANVEFLGDGEAIVEINKTSEYSVNLITGQYEKID